MADLLPNILPVRTRDKVLQIPERTIGTPLRRSYERLKPWLDLANLLPPPPSRSDHDRPEPLKFTGDPFIQILAWKSQVRAMHPADLVRRFEDAGLADVPAIKASLDLQLLREHLDQARSFLDLVLEIASVLRGITTLSSPATLKAAGSTPLLIDRLYQLPATLRSEVWVRHGVIATAWVDPFRDFLSALEGVGVNHVRRCPMCKHFFFALRRDQKACSKSCNAARRVRAWRANQVRHEYHRKLKKAGVPRKP